MLFEEDNIINEKPMFYNKQQKDLIRSHSEEIVRRLSILTRNIEEYPSLEILLKVMNGCMTDIFDDYRRLHAVILKYKEISNEELIRCFKLP